MGRLRKLASLCGCALVSVLCMTPIPNIPLKAAAVGCEANGYCYVTATGAGAKTGVDWNNAYADLPSSLTRGVRYFLAGSATSYGVHTFTDADSGATAITIYKAVDCSVVPSAPYCETINPASVAGWQSSYGSTPATWSDAPQSDPLTSTSSEWAFCSDYYTVDGITGTTSPLGPSGQGFVLATQNKKIDGIVNIGDCTGSPPAGLTNISLTHLEVGGTGLMPYYPSPVTGCTYTGGSATITTTNNIGGIAGDKVEGHTSANSIIFLNTAATSISPTTVIVPLASSPCSTLAFVSLDFAPAPGLYVINRSSATETFTNITIQNNYIHDVSETLRIYNGYYINILHDYLARNRSTPTQHGSIVQFDEGTNDLVDGPATVAYNFLLDPNGTGTIEHLGQPTGCRRNCGTIKGLYVYGNIVTCESSPPAYKCGVGHATVGDNNGENNVQNLFFYNNTITRIAPAGVYLLSSSSTGAVAEDNVFYNIPGVNAVRFYGAGSDRGITHDYNTVLNSTLLYQNHCQTHDVCTTSGSADPFVNDASYDFHLTFDMDRARRTGAAQGLPLSLPYNVDLDGNTRGADGTWERGAYEFILGKH